MSDAKHESNSKKDQGSGHDDGHAKKHKKHGGGGHGGMPHEEHEGAPEWLISFADMVMLMMGFFVILFALNVQPKGGNPGGGGEENEGVAAQPDMIDFAIAVRKAFHNDVEITSTDPKDAALVQRLLMQQKNGAGESKDEGTKGKDQNVRSVRPSDTFGRGTSVEFPSLSATLDETGMTSITDIARNLKGQSTVVEIRGHVGAAEKFGSPDQAMELSMQRAMNAAKAIAASGVDWWRIRVSAAGSGERVEQFPTDRAADAKNARVEVRVLDEIAAPREPLRPMAQAADGSH
ncbi:MAG: hypothetical protein DWH96_11505 [Planctomycetota bacterium]|nr:MAG: hypothetical protein DWH96_11505 [Planctomycetota bacterium]RLS92684.1 MAG: hypothetical protein DWI11_08625 [Planctomycetota bacterium]